jgi:hypothetical protein
MKIKKKVGAIRGRRAASPLMTTRIWPPILDFKSPDASMIATSCSGNRNTWAKNVQEVVVFAGKGFINTGSRSTGHKP